MAKQSGVTVNKHKEYDAGTKIFSLEDNLKAFNSGSDMTSLPFAAEIISKFLIEGNLAKQAPNLSKIFDDQFVKAYADSKKAS